MSGQRNEDGTFAPGTAANPYGRGARKRRIEAELKAEAEAFEAERKAEETALVNDLGRVPSHTEIALVEQLSVLIARGRALRRSGQGADAEMVARLVIRGLGKLGVRQGDAKPAMSVADRWAAEEEAKAKGGAVA